MYITSPKEINLTAGGSQVKINGSGIFPTTGGLFEVKSGQQKFTGGQKLNYVVPNLPVSTPLFSNKVDIVNIFPKQNFEALKFSAVYEDGKIVKGNLDSFGRTSRIRSNKNEKVKVLIGGEDWFYYASRLGGTKEEETYIKFVNFNGEPIANLMFRLLDEKSNILISLKTDSNGEAKFISNKVKQPCIAVKRFNNSEFKAMFKIESEFIRELILISPKVLVDIDLLEEGAGKGNYLRSYYDEEEI